MSTFTSAKHILTLGEQLERNRLLQNVPQSELAIKAGVSTRTLRRLESGEGGSMDSFIRVLMALGLDGNLSALIPDSTVRPMERARKNKTERLRASRSNQARDNVNSSQSNNSKKIKNKKSKPSWTWGDEE